MAGTASVEIPASMTFRRPLRMSHWQQMPGPLKFEAGGLLAPAESTASFVSGIPWQFIVPAFFRLPVVDWNCHIHFWIDSQTIGNAIDVVEVADHLSCHGDLRVVKAELPEILQILRVHLPGPERQLHREVTKSPVSLAQFCRAIVKDQLLRKLRIPGLQTEVACVRESSVIAVIDVADDGGQHLPSRGTQ